MGTLSLLASVNQRGGRRAGWAVIIVSLIEAWRARNLNGEVP
jgi:hypothetical protein